MPDGYDVRFDDSLRAKAREIGSGMKLPSATVDPRVLLAHAYDDVEDLKQKLREEREKSIELRTLLRSALWELARVHGAANPQTWAIEWYRKRKAAP